MYKRQSHGRVVVVARIQLAPFLEEAGDGVLGFLIFLCGGLDELGLLEPVAVVVGCSPHDPGEDRWSVLSDEFALQVVDFLFLGHGVRERDDP